MDSVFTVLRVAVSLAAVLGLIWYLNKRVSKGKAVGRRKKANQVTVVSKQSIGSKASVVIIDAEGQRFVLGVTEHNVAVLHAAEAPAVEEVAVAEDFESALADVDEDAIEKDATSAPAGVLSPVAGSILDKATWRLAFESVRAGITK